MTTLGSMIQGYRRDDARRLQAAQASMGVPGQLPPSRGVGPDLQARLTSLRPSAPDVRDTIRRVNASAEAAWAVTQQRALDINVAQRLLQVTDLGLSKPTRRFLLQGLERDLGINPRGQYQRDLNKVIESLDVDNAQVLRTLFVGQVDDAAPGAVTAGVRAVLTGEMPFHELVQRASYVARDVGTRREAEAAAIFDGGPQRVQLAQAADDLPPAGTTPPLMREVAPELAAVLGLDPTQRQRNVEIISRSHPAIATVTPADQQRMANTIREARGAAVQTMVLATQMADLIRGRPEALSAGLDIPRVGRVGGNVPSFMVQWRDFIRGLDTIFTAPGRTPQDAPRNWQGLMDRLSARARGQTGEEMEVSARTQFLARETARSIVERLPEDVRQTFWGRAEEAARLNVRIEAMSVHLAYALARAADPGGRLSDQDIEVQLRRIGRSASPEIFEAGLTGLVADAYSGYQRQMLALTGGVVPIDIAINPGDARTLTESPLTPPELQQVLEQRQPPTAQPAPGAQPSQQPPDAATTPDGIRVRRVPTIPVEGQPPAAPPEPRPQPPQGRQGRYPTIEEEERLRAQLAEEERARVRRREVRDEERLGLARAGEARAVRREEQQQRDRIRDAFATVGRVLASSVSARPGGPISGGGGDQDPSAFRITPAPQRRPPQPVEAAPYQPQPRRRGR